MGAALRRAGHRVLTALAGRSAYSCDLALKAGLADAGNLQELVRQVDIMLSIVPPAAADEFAAEVAGAMVATGARPLFVDCNAVSPATMRQIASRFDALGGAVVDVGIVGRAPPTDLPVRFFHSGLHSQLLAKLASGEIHCIDLGGEVGRASALKMTYAALNKGSDALHATILLLAERLGVREPLMKEFALSQAPVLRRMQDRVPFLAATAERFVGEMHQISATCQSVGVTPDFHAGAAWLYATLAQTTLASETRATLDRNRTLDEALALYLQALPPVAPAE
ncbi:MAG: NAD(P)-dependent oxidoreductase [Proteobacteria bacterium]|nr:NAD(P)-dependent oxidoreductase [Pseudomonadota bacterium]